MGKQDGLEKTAEKSHRQHHLSQKKALRVKESLVATHENL